MVLDQESRTLAAAVGINSVSFDLYGRKMMVIFASNITSVCNLMFLLVPPACAVGSFVGPIPFCEVRAPLATFQAIGDLSKINQPKKGWPSGWRLEIRFGYCLLNDDLRAILVFES